MTQILFERSGGFAGLRMTAAIQLDTLPAEESSLLADLLDKADFFALPEFSSAPPAPDEFNYTITVEEADRRHTLHTTDTAAPENLRPLLNELSKRARPQRR